MPRSLVIAIDLVAIAVLSLGIYFPRYRRRDMVIAYLGLNVGVMTVAVALSNNTSIGTGFGLGLFGALSIIRLRSDELGHEEVAYYFAALSLGLLGGIEINPTWMEVALPAAIVLVMFIGDHPLTLSGYRQQIVTLGRAIPNEVELRNQLEQLLKCEVKHITVRRLDTVNDTTVVDVRFRLPRGSR